MRLEDTDRIPTHKAVIRNGHIWARGTHYYDHKTDGDYILYGSLFDGVTYVAVIPETLSEYTGRKFDGEPIYQNDLFVWESIDDALSRHTTLRVTFKICKIDGEFYAVSQDEKGEREKLSEFLKYNESYESIVRLSNSYDPYANFNRKQLYKGMNIITHDWASGTLNPPNDDNVFTITTSSNEVIPVYRSSICKATDKKSEDGNVIFERDILTYTLEEGGPKREGVAIVDGDIVIVHERQLRGASYRYFEDRSMKNIKITGSLVGSTLSSN